MTGIFIMLGGMVLFATVIGILDLLGDRQQKRREAHARAAKSHATASPASSSTR